MQAAELLGNALHCAAERGLTGIAQAVKHAGISVCVEMLVAIEHDVYWEALDRECTEEVE